MLQSASKKSHKLSPYEKNCYENDLIICIVVHETRRQNKYGLLIKDLLSFTHGLFRSLNNSYFLFLCPPQKKAETQSAL